MLLNEVTGGHLKSLHYSSFAVLNGKQMREKMSVNVS